MTGKNTTECNGSQNEGSKVPTWLKEDLFEKLLSDTVPGYKKIKKFNAVPALAPGENYATIMLRLNIEIEKEDGDTKCLSYMLKVAHDNELFQEFAENHNLFDVEVGMYLEIVPEFEKLYRNVGADIKFKAQCYKLNIEKDNVLLEDLRPRGFKNADRLVGLDMEHAKCVLRKLAQWHAASALFFELNGDYSPLFKYGYLHEKSRDFMKKFYDSTNKVLMKCATLYKGHENYLTAMDKFQANCIDQLYKAAEIDTNAFNVLNHGDCWTNNIMFSYDKAGRVEETYLVDYQCPKYGSPAQDLLYFILSSTQLELKLNQFDYFVKFYHDNLIEHLTLLKYPKKFPTLRDLHISILKHSAWVFATISGVMAAVLLDPDKDASFDNFVGDNEHSDELKYKMFSNERYRKHAAAILLWLYNRGGLECQ